MTKMQEILRYAPAEFETPVTVKTFFETIRIYSLMGDEDHGIWLRLSDGEWYRLGESDKFFDRITNDLLTELRCRQRIITTH